MEPQEDWVLDPDLGVKLPPKPDKPADGDCCGTGCNPCIMTLYQMKLRTWKKTVKQIKADAGLN
jgi:hypothetical protein